MSVTPKPAMERLAAMSDIPSLFECWIFLGHTDGRTSQYGRIRGDDGKLVYAHRLSYEHYHGPIPDGMEVDHTCEITLCWNPSHLQLQTPEQNKALYFLRRAWESVPERRRFTGGVRLIHTCHARECTAPVPPKLLMCYRHWKMVPKHLQTRIWATYRRGQEIDKNPSEAYMEAQRAAVNAVAELEGIA